MSGDCVLSFDDELKQIDQEYGAVCSQLGLAFLRLEEATEQVSKLKAQRTSIMARYQDVQKAQRMQKPEAETDHG